MKVHEILSLIRDHRLTTKQIQNRFSATIAKPFTERMLFNLQVEGKITTIQGGKWILTDRGLASLPAAQPKRIWGKYVPPAPPPRRAGSEVAAALPSMVAGIRYWPRGVR